MVSSASVIFPKVKNVNDDEAWDRFYRLYAPLICGIAHQCSLSSAMVDEVLQETMIQLSQYLQRFDYDRGKGRFRTFLYRVVMRRIGRIAAKICKKFGISKQRKRPLASRRP